MPFSELTNEQKLAVHILIEISGISSGVITFGKDDEASINIIPGKDGQIDTGYVTGTIPTNEVGRPYLNI